MLKRIIGIAFSSLFLITAAQAATVCPSDKPAQWTDGTCYTCEEFSTKFKAFMDQKGGRLHTSGQMTFNNGDTTVTMTGDDPAILSVIMNFAEVCTESNER